LPERKDLAEFRGEPGARWGIASQVPQVPKELHVCLRCKVPCTAGTPGT